jgi:hypothetical protein
MPRGVYNHKPRSKETRDKYSIAIKKAHADPNSGYNTEEYKENQQTIHKRLRTDPNSVYNTEEYKENHKVCCYKSRKPREIRTCALSGCNKTFECKINSKQHFCCKSHAHKDKCYNWQGGKTYFKLNGELKRHDIVYKELFEKQNGLCAICGKEETHTFKGKIKQLSIDHDHKTGEVRGLLCNKCNTGLGGFMDNVEFLLKAIQYLKVT